MERLDLVQYYQWALEHRLHRQCGGVPYAYGDMLSVLVAGSGARKMLELGTGVGYSTACLLRGNKAAEIDTIDQDASHISLATAKWEELGIASRIQTFTDKAEVILPTLKGTYDVIFFDGYDPSMKFLAHFERMLTKGGMLITANLF